MSWSEIIGHEAVVERFKRAAHKGRLVSTYLFVGPDGIGKRKFALKLAQSVLCEVNPEEQLEPCGSCPGCQQVAASTHPDLIQISKPEDKANIPVETFIGDRDHRMQVGLCHDISLKPFSGTRKVAIIDDSDALNQESANALLKTLVAQRTLGICATAHQYPEGFRIGARCGVEPRSGYEAFLWTVNPACAA